MRFSAFQSYHKSCLSFRGSLVNMIKPSRSAALIIKETHVESSQGQQALVVARLLVVHVQWIMYFSEKTIFWKSCVMIKKPFH